MSNILITGGAGFIGVNSAAHFLSKGWSVTVMDNFSRKGSDLNADFLKTTFPDASLTFYKGDIRSAEDVRAAFQSKPDAVLHLAGQVAVTTSVVDPRTDFDINALGTFNVLEEARRMEKKPTFIFASTNKVYGGLEHMEVVMNEKRYAFKDAPRGVTENVPLDFHSPYGCSKGSADQYVRDYARIYGLKSVVFRQSCVYGQHQMGIEDQGWVAWFMIAGMYGRPVTIYGNGKQVRDLLHVDDLVQAYDLAVENPDTVAGKIYNLGGGMDNTLSLMEFLEDLQARGLAMQLSYAAERPGDQPIFVSDNSLAGKDLGWKPQVGVKDGIGRLHEWLVSNKDLLATIYA